MKKIVITLALIGLLVAPVIGLAETEQQSMPNTVENVGDLITKIEDIGNWIFTGLLALAAIFLVVAGYYFITAGGNPEKANVARQMLINALIGVAVGVAAKGLIAVITNIVAE